MPHNRISQSMFHVLTIETGCETIEQMIQTVETKKQRLLKAKIALVLYSGLERVPEEAEIEHLFHNIRNMAALKFTNPPQQKNNVAQSPTLV